MSATLQPGDRVIVGGRPATFQGLNDKVPGDCWIKFDSRTGWWSYHSNDVERMPAAPRSPDAVWLPIETAPRGAENEFIGWDGVRMDKTWEGWTEDDKPVYVRADYISWQPILWTPLPTPPVQPRSRGDEPAAPEHPSPRSTSEGCSGVQVG